MEPKRKVMASASCVENESRKDRLSSLPDEVVHHILNIPGPIDLDLKDLSLPDEVVHHILNISGPIDLDLKDLTLFSCVSKRCRQLFLSNPTLRFNVFPDTYRSTCEDRLRLMNSLDRLLAHREDNKLQFFDILWYSHCKKGLCLMDEAKFRVLTWVHSVLVRCKVETLYLYIEDGSLSSPSDYDKLLLLPTLFFHAESLRSVMVDCHCKIRVPSFDFSSNLKSLELRYVTIVDEEFFKWISCCCNCIEELYLDCVHGPKSIAIQSSSLKSFRFEACYFSELSLLHISAEMLKEIFIEWEV